MIILIEIICFFLRMLWLCFFSVCLLLPVISKIFAFYDIYVRKREVLVFSMNDLQNAEPASICAIISAY
jgi:hypothetical protein